MATKKGSISALRRLFRWGARTQGPNQFGPGGAAGKRNRQSPYDVYQGQLKTPRDRNKQYDLYEELDEISEIASVLDAYAEDATQYDKEKKASIWIEGKNKKIVDECNMLLKRLEMEEHIEAIARDVAKNGDDFGRLLHFDPTKDPEKARLGVLGIEWHDPRYIERVEDDNGILLGFMDSDKTGAASIAREDMFMPWDFVHFRMRTRKYATMTGANIYGTSLLKNASRPGKQMKMLDDMLAILRLNKTFDKRVYEIDVGDATPEEIPSILRQWQQIFTRANWRDLISGEVSQLYDPLAVDDDIFWPKRKGSESKVTTTPADPNVRDLADVDHKRNQLFGALRAPKGYFGFDESGSTDAQTSISSKDIRFARLVKKLQRAIINGITRICQIHLALREMDTNLENFQVMMVEPSAIEHVHRLEAMQVLIDISERMLLMGDHMALEPVRWRTHILRKVFGFSDTDLKMYFVKELIQKQQDDQGQQQGGQGGGAIPMAPVPPADPNDPAQSGGGAPTKEALNAAVARAIISKKLDEAEVYFPPDPYLTSMDFLPEQESRKRLSETPLPGKIIVGNRIFEKDAEGKYQFKALVIPEDEGEDTEDAK